ncbi:MAG: radical SAM/SPASM domain-containing protein [Flavisolibacter sp.]
MITQSLYHTFKRYRTLQTNRISSLPIVILMPHSACNCRCVMCDIWKDNQNIRQITEVDVKDLLASLKKFGTQQVVMSGGEALLHNRFFQLCDMLRSAGIRVSLLSTGLALKKNASQIASLVNDVVVSLDGDEATHDLIRNIPNAFHKLRAGVLAIREIDPLYRITARTVIHKMNFRKWPAIIKSAQQLGLDQISFLPADVSSHAFNREVLWSDLRQHEILPAETELPELQFIIDLVTNVYADQFASGFIAETPEKIRKIYQYYASFYGLNPLPFKKCNAPWVSTVIEADGSVRPCFFHEAIGNIHTQSLEFILNSNEAMQFRKNLDMDTDPTCTRCVCYLNLPPGMNLKS